MASFFLVVVTIVVGLLFRQANDDLCSYEWQVAGAQWQARSARWALRVIIGPWNLEFGKV